MVLDKAHPRLSQLQPLAAAVLVLATFAAPARAAQDSADTSPARPHDAVLEAYYRGETEQARAAAAALLEADDADALAEVLLGLALDGLGELEESDRHLARAVELGSGESEILRLAGDLHATRYAAYLADEATSTLAAEQLARAEALYGAWAALETGSALPIQRLAWLKRAGGDGRSSIGMLFAAIARDPMADQPHADLWSQLGADLSYATLASFYAGLALASGAPAERARALNYQGQVLIAQGQQLRIDASNAASRGADSERLTLLERAKEAFGAALDPLERSAGVQPELAGAARWYTLDARQAVVEVYADLGDLAAARRAVPAVKETLLAALAPENEAFGQAVFRLSDALFKASGGEGGSKDGMEELAELWKWATAMVDGNADWWNNYGFFCREAERFEESYAAYLRCIALAPDNVRYVNDTGLIQLYHLGTDLERALELFQTAVALGEEQYESAKDERGREAEMRSAYGDALLNLGRIQTLNRNFQEAEDALARLDALDAGRDDLLESRFELLLARRDIAGAREMVAQSLAGARAHAGVARGAAAAGEAGAAAEDEAAEAPLARRPSYRLMMFQRALEHAAAEQGDDPELTRLLGEVEESLRAARERRAAARDSSAR